MEPSDIYDEAFSWTKNNCFRVNGRYLIKSVAQFQYDGKKYFTYMKVSSTFNQPNSYDSLLLIERQKLSY